MVKKKINEQFHKKIEKKKSKKENTVFPVFSFNILTNSGPSFSYSI